MPNIWEHLHVLLSIFYFNFVQSPIENMIFIIPFIIGAIGVAVGAVGGAFAAHAAGEKDRQESKSHRQINNDLVQGG